MLATGPNSTLRTKRISSHPPTGWSVSALAPDRTIFPGGPPSNNNAEDRQPERHHLGSVHTRISTLAEDLSSDHGLPRANPGSLPLMGQVANLAPFRKQGQAIESVGEHPFMLLGSPRASERATNRMVNKDCPRRRDLNHDVAHRANHQGGDRSGLNGLCEETDGLVAEWSVRDQHLQVSTGLC